MFNIFISGCWRRTIWPVPNIWKSHGIPSTAAEWWSKRTIPVSKLLFQPAKYNKPITHLFTEVSKGKSPFFGRPMKRFHTVQAYSYFLARSQEWCSLLWIQTLPGIKIKNSLAEREITSFSQRYFFEHAQGRPNNILLPIPVFQLLWDSVILLNSITKSYALQ